MFEESIMKWERQKRMRTWIKKIVNRETVLYAFFGVLTSLLNVFLFKFLLWCGLDYKIGNIITLIVVKLTAYLCNKNFVFESHCADFKELMGEFFRFLVARGATALIDYFGLIFAVEALSFDKFYSKIVITVFVVVLNYVLGKAHVFKKRK